MIPLRTRISIVSCIICACHDMIFGLLQGNERRISKLQLVELLGSSTLECELQEPMLTRAIDMMDPIGAAELVADSTPRVDFGNFYVWWTTSNFADPQGFSDSLMPMVLEDPAGQLDPLTGKPVESEPVLDEWGEPEWLPRPTASRVSLRYCASLIKRGDGNADDGNGEDGTAETIIPPTAAELLSSPSVAKPRGRKMILDIPSTTSSSATAAGATTNDSSSSSSSHPGEHPEMKKSRRRRSSLDAGLGANLFSTLNDTGGVAAQHNGEQQLQEEDNDKVKALQTTVRELQDSLNKRLLGLENQMVQLDTKLDQRASVCAIEQYVHSSRTP